MALKENKLTWAARMSLNASAIRRFTTPLVKQPSPPHRTLSSSRYVSTRSPWGQTTKGSDGTCFALVPREPRQRPAALQIICVTQARGTTCRHGSGQPRGTAGSSVAPLTLADSQRGRSTPPGQKATWEPGRSLPKTGDGGGQGESAGQGRV